MDALTLLRQQHDETDAAFERYEQLPPTETESRKEIARSIIADLSVHAAIEEMAFYPTIREALPELDDMIRDDLEEHQEVKELLSELEGTDPSEPRFDTLMGELIVNVRDHVEEEEEELFPKVEAAFTDEELTDLGEAMEQLAATAPTRPHPRQPNEPPGNVLVGPVAAVIDRIRDAVRDRAGKGSV